jgi:uncharacterized repeat protein (TIGR02543 family)
MSKNFNRIKSEAELIHQIINDRYRASNTLNENSDVIKLTTAFSRIIEARETSFDSFDKLFKKRLEVYDTMFSLFYMSYFSNILFVNAGLISNLFKLLDITGTQEFFNNFLEALYLKQNNPTSQRLIGLSDYFSIKFSELSLEIYPDSLVEFKLNDQRGLYVDNVLISQSQKEEDKIFEMLYFLGALSNIKDNNFIDEVSNYYEYLIDNETNFNKVIKDRISYRLTIIDSAIKSNKYMDTYREEKDPAYKKTYIQDILTLFDELSEVIVNFSDLGLENLTTVKQSGIYGKLFSLIVDIDGKVNSSISSTFESIKVIEEILENYSIFVRLPSVENSNLLNSIKTAEDSHKDFDKYSNVIETKFFFNPFSSILTLTDWVKEITKDKNLNGNINVLMLLYIGANLKEFSSADLSKSISEYAFVNLTRKKLIVEGDKGYLSDEFILKKRKEQELIVVNKIRVKERPQDDLIGFAYKSILPSLEILDYMSFEEVFVRNNPNSSPFNFESSKETDFRLQLKLLIIEAILKDRKNINNNISKLIDSVSDMPKENLKTLYLEICFREAIGSFVSYLEPLAEVSNFSNSIINEDTYNKMNDYSYDPDNTIYNEIKSVINKYIEVWEFLYSTDIDLVDRGLKQFSGIEADKNYIRNLALGVIYIVSFNSQSGSSISPINALVKSLITAPIAPTRSGFTFAGWFKDSATTQPWNFTTDRVYSNITLYAKWVV